MTYSRVLVLALLVLAGLFLLWLEPVERGRLLDWGGALIEHPAALPLLVLTQALLFTLAMPGSAVLWLTAPFLAPPLATGVLVTGSVTGALGAYLLSRWMSAEARERLGRRPAYRVLERNSGTLTQCALRMLPGFPHSVVNYAAGVLRLPLPGFLLAAVVGLTVKWAFYAAAVHALIAAGDPDAALGAWAVLPLLLLALFLGGGSYIRQWLLRGRRRQDDSEPV